MRRANRDAQVFAHLYPQWSSPLAQPLRSLDDHKTHADWEILAFPGGIKPLLPAQSLFTLRGAGH